MLERVGLGREEANEGSAEFGFRLGIDPDQDAVAGGL